MGTFTKRQFHKRNLIGEKVESKGENSSIGGHRKFLWDVYWVVYVCPLGRENVA